MITTRHLSESVHRSPKRSANLGEKPESDAQRRFRRGDIALDRGMGATFYGRVGYIIAGAPAGD